MSSSTHFGSSITIKEAREDSNITKISSYRNVIIRVAFFMAGQQLVQKDVLISWYSRFGLQLLHNFHFGYIKSFEEVYIYICRM